MNNLLHREVRRAFGEQNKPLLWDEDPNFLHLMAKKAFGNEEKQQKDDDQFHSWLILLNPLLNLKISEFKK